MNACPLADAYQYPIETKTEYFYYVHGDKPNYSPGNVTVFQNDAPDWVVPVHPPELVSPMPGEPDNPNLLLDKQSDVTSNTRFVHFEFKVWNAFDAMNLSGLAIPFDPQLETLTLHEIKLWRDGKWIDKLDMKELRIVQREDELDEHLYKGALSALLFLEDVREGDLLDYSFSVQNTRYRTYFDWLPLQFSHRWEKYCGRIVKAPGRSTRVQINPPNFDCNFTESAREYSWHIEPCQPHEKIFDLPPGYPVPASLEISEFCDWNDVACQLAHLFPINPAFAQDPEVIALVDHWKTHSSSQSETAAKAMRFVQDEVRYLGIEDGMSGIQPADPLATLKRRFGDCKDKTQLLRSFFAVLDLPSNPCLVNTSLGKNAANHLPMPAFNHAILQFELDGKPFFIDATQMYDGGGLEQMDLPFGAGLILADKTMNLTDIPQSTIHPDIECRTIFDIQPNYDLEMSIDVHFKGCNATSLRRNLKLLGVNDVAKNYLKDVRRQFGPFQMVQPIQINDDRDANDISASATLLLKDPWINESDDSPSSFVYIPLFLPGYIDQDVDPDRSLPLQTFHTNIKETFEVHGGTIGGSSETVEHKAFTFTVRPSNCSAVECELQTHLDVLEPEDIPSYCEKLDEASQAMEIIVNRN